MPVESPLEHTELRHIEQSLDDGNTQEAASRLGQLADAPDHKDAIDFLTTRLLFQRGRIDSDGAADRLGAILERIEYFPEAEDWLAELEGRTERSVLGDLPLPGSEEDALPAPSSPPSSRAPSVPRRLDRSHPYFDELQGDDDVTPTESLGGPRDADDLRLDSSDPPPRHSQPDFMGSEPPTRPDLIQTDSLGIEPPTRPDGKRLQLGGTEPPARPSHMPFDSLRAKEQLSAEAGRYRGGNDGRPEITGAPRRSRSPAAARHSNRVPADPERRILEVLRLAQEGLWDQARALLPDEPAPPSLRPELRTALGRVLIELGHAERASVEAAIALEQAPQNPETRLVFVWSAVRYARQRDDAWSLERAGRILKELHLSPGLDAGLLDALGACVEARVGIPAVALRLAQRALRTDASSIDGLAALAEAAALCGEDQRAEAALSRLFDVSESAAEQITPRLRRLGVGEHGPTSSTSVWFPLEHTLSSGAREVALAGLETLAEEALAGLPILRVEDGAQLAEVARGFFSLAPVLRHFGPYDLSLKSLERLEAGLGLLYGLGPRALDVAGVGHALWQLAGLYLGETLRQSCGGQWQGTPEVLADARLSLLGLDVQPFQVVRHRIIHGRHAMLRSALGRVLAEAPESAHGFRVVAELAPPAPWGDRDWPLTEDLPRLGRALGHSVVAAYAADHGQVALDRSSKSLEALDRYLELVAPADAPLAKNSAWARWLSAFLGAYLGEVLCKELGGAWLTGSGPDAEAFVIELGERQVAPVAWIMAAMQERRPNALADYVAQLRQTSAPS
jgi:hypothetical protein